MCRHSENCKIQQFRNRDLRGWATTTGLWRQCCQPPAGPCSARSMADRSKQIPDLAALSATGASAVLPWLRERHAAVCSGPKVYRVAVGCSLDSSPGFKFYQPVMLSVRVVIRYAYAAAGIRLVARRSPRPLADARRSTRAAPLSPRGRPVGLPHDRVPSRSRQGSR